MKLPSFPFLSFLKKKLVPSREEVSLLYQDTFSLYKAILLFFTVGVVLLVFYTLLALSSSISVELPASGGTLRVGVTGAPHAINPLIASTPTDMLLSQLIYSGLIKPSSDPLAITPDLASSVVPSSDKKEYRFTLKNTLLFSNKAPLSVDDVVFSFETKKRIMLDQNPESEWGYIFAEAVDANTVRIWTSGAVETLFPTLSLGIISKEVWKDVPYDAFADSTLHSAPVSSGPYVLKRSTYKKTVPQNVILKKNPHYSVSKPYIRTIVLSIYANQSALLESLQKGHIDVTTMLTPESLQDKKDLERTFSIMSVPTRTSIDLFVQPEQKNSVTASAISLLEPFIDKRSVLDTIQYGYGMLEQTASNTSTQYSVHETDARIALSKAGYIQDSSGVLKKNGSPVALSILVQKDETFLKTAQLLASQLSKVGIVVELKVFDQGLFVEQVRLGTYNYVLGATSDYTKKYQTLISLYKTVVPLVHTSSVHTRVDTTDYSYGIQSNYEVFKNIEHWYVRTDRVWKWFQNYYTDY